MGLGRSLLLGLAGNRWLARTVPASAAGRRAAWRFMPGERLSDAVRAALALRVEGISCVLTALGEDVTSAAQADAAASKYVVAAEALAVASLDVHVSAKPTHLGLALNASEAAERVSAIASRVRELGGVLWIDMESSALVEPTLSLFESLRPSHTNLALCLQAYLLRTPADVERLLPLKPRIRLVKGAYREPPEAVFQGRAEVDRAYEAVARQLVGGGAEVALATHDLDLVERLEVDSEVQMLYGIRVADQRRLVGQGRPVRVLISYGSEWFAWYVRRIAERPANVLFALRAAVGS